MARTGSTSGIPAAAGPSLTRLAGPVGSSGPATAGRDDLPAAPRDGTEVCVLPADLLQPAVAVRDWLLVGASADDPEALLGGFGERLNELGIPVDRMTTAIDTLHSEYSGIGRIWTRDGGSSFRLFPHGETSHEIYRRSPFYAVHQSREWLRLDLDATPDDRFGIVPELREEGYHDYLAVPMFFTNGTEAGLALASRTPGGFDARAVDLLRFVMPTFAAVLEMRAVSSRLDNVLRIYVGDEPHREILSGAIRRGQVSRIRSAILFADMRSYTHITSNLSPEAAVDLLNAYFDCLVPAIEAEGGEILKYMGDGLLAIVRDQGDDTGRSAQAALQAAISALVKLEEANADGRFPVRVSAGIALHHGEAAYGNVGSGSRLDFTVIGPDVNLASRMSRLNKVLDEPLLMSRAFADHLWGDPEPLGKHLLDGFDDPVAIYRLRPDAGPMPPADVADPEPVLTG